MIHSFIDTISNPWHFTVESLLPLIDNLELIKEGDTVIIPDYKFYPTELVKRIVGDNVIVKTASTKEYTGVYIPCYLRTEPHINRVPFLCQKLLAFVQEKNIAGTGIYMNFRMHNRRWIPHDNIQKLIDCLKDKYTIVLSLNPKCENTTIPMNYTGAIKVYDLSYEEQLAYAKGCKYAIYNNGAGMLFPQINALPSIMLTPCKLNEIEPINIQSLYPSKTLKVLSDKLPAGNYWNNDIETISVKTVIEQLQTLMETNE